MAVQLFECNPLSMGGIKRMKLATRDMAGDPLDFPLDIVLKSNDDSIITLSDSEDLRQITLGTQQINYRIVYPINASIIEEETTDNRGRYYQQKLSFEMPQLSLLTNNQLKDFLFTSGGEFAISSMVCFIEDLNDNYWICGYNTPMILDAFDLQTDVESGDNKYILSYTCRSYSKIRQYELL